MVYVEVMYSDLSRRRVLLEEIDSIPKDNVLFITVSAPDPEKGGELRGLAAKGDLDHYAVCLRKWNEADWVLLFGWNDEDFVWRRITNPWEPATKLQVEAPLGCMHVIFNGVAVPHEVWEQAQQIFKSEMI